TFGATGLPVIAAGDSLTIVGNGDTIERREAAETPAFRLFAVDGGAALTLQNLTLQGGRASGTGVEAEGGAIYNQGSLGLNGVTVQKDYATRGGGIWSRGSLALAGCTVQYNNATQGGGVWSSGSAKLAGCTLQYNNAENDGALDGGGGIWTTGSLTMAG